MVRRSIFLGVLVAVAFASQAQAQSLPDMTGLDLNAMNNAFNANLNAAMAQSQSRIVAQVLQSPDFQAKYQAFLGQGGQASPEQYALEYARFGGFTPEGIARGKVESKLLTRMGGKEWLSAASRGVQREPHYQASQEVTYRGTLPDL